MTGNRLPDPLRRLAVPGLVSAALAASAGAQGAREERPGCPKPRASAAYTSRVARALAAKQDVWGNALLRAPNGPTHERASGYLNPLLLARAPGKRSLTASGVHYVPFSQPLDGFRGAGSVALHVADGSQVVADRTDGRSLTIGVGRSGHERYGSCLSRLDGPRLAAGYLPILETSYVDAAGVRYRQESFAARIAQTRSLVSFVRVRADARAASGAARIRLAPSVAGLRARGGRLLRGSRVHLYFGAGGRFDGRAVGYPVPRGTARTVFAMWVNYPAPGRALTLDEDAYEAARRTVAAYWERRLAEGMTVAVPERRVLDAQRSLVIQNLALTWRYSIGNPYEQFSFPESVDVAQVMGEYGFGAVARSILRTSLTRRPTPYPNWKMGEKLLGSASYYRLHRDRAYVEQVTPVLRRYVVALGRGIGPRRILGRERYSSDIPDQVYGLHSQAVAWQGLREMGSVWAETGHASLARRSRGLAGRLGAGLRRAVAVSQRRLPDGSLFVPVRLLDREGPYDALMRSRSGSYWNLVMPYALASGLLPPRGPQANGIFRYMQRHGSRFLGLVRAGAYSLYRDPAYPTSGTDEVYGVNVARFLADSDRPDQLVLSLYGGLAAGMAPGTFVSGEAASLAPLGGAFHRAMYLPPNGAGNAAFLVKLRLMLVHERRDRNGLPHGLELAYATPRDWLRPGRRIAVERAPTSFGPLSFSIAATEGSVQVSLDVPDRARPRRVSMRVRLPRPSRITSVLLDGRPFSRFDARTETVDLSGLRGRIELVVRHRRR